mmetsp:Transcript_90703/g.146771  ORF Transcript_90703/g.146771 Transcript_90703/m.146771 type:complete len:110 (-) Transcript_90703:1488-1817(-)
MSQSAVYLGHVSRRSLGATSYRSHNLSWAAHQGSGMVGGGGGGGGAGGACSRLSLSSDESDSLWNSSGTSVSGVSNVSRSAKRDGERVLSGSSIERWISSSSCNTDRIV